MKLFYTFIGIFAVIVFYIRCISLAGYSTGRSAGKDNWEVTGSGNWSNSPFFYPFDDGDGVNLNDEPSLLSLEVEARRGVSDHVDVGFRLTAVQLGGIAKVQVLGDQNSPFAVSTGIEVGRFYKHVYYQVPLFFSYHFKDGNALYISPRYIKQYSQNIFLEKDFDFIGYAGCNLGFQTGGKKVKLCLDGGWYSMGGGYYGKGVSDEGRGVMTLGIGVKLLFPKR